MLAHELERLSLELCSKECKACETGEFSGHKANVCSLPQFALIHHFPKHFQAGIFASSGGGGYDLDKFFLLLSLDYHPLGSSDNLILPTEAFYSYCLMMGIPIGLEYAKAGGDGSSSVKEGFDIVKQVLANKRCEVKASLLKA